MKRILAISTLLFLAGCQAKTTDGPPAITYGRDVCHRCGMIVSEARFASGYVDEAGESVVFDDVGELLKELTTNPKLTSKAYINDFSGSGWVLVEMASYVHVPAFPTPMGSGIVAFSAPSAAQSFAQLHPGSHVVGLAEILRL